MLGSPNSNNQLEGHSLFYLNFPRNEFQSAIKSAAIELSKAKTQARISQKPKLMYLKNIYKDTQLCFMYDFYKENDIDNFKIFLENFYAALEESFVVQKQKPNSEFNSGFNSNVEGPEPQIPKKDSVEIPKKTESLDVSLIQMKDLQKNMLSTLKSLMIVNENFKGYFDDQKQLLDQLGIGTKERKQFNDQSNQGKKILDAFHQIFDSFEKSLKLIEDVCNDKPDRNILPLTNAEKASLNPRSKAEIAPAMRGDAESNVYASAETFAKKSDHSPRLTDIALDTYSKEIMTEVNSANLETNQKAIIALIDKLMNNIPKKKQGSINFDDEFPVMSKNLFRFLTDLEREIRLNSSVLKSPSPKKDSMLNSTQLEEELEELRWQKSLMEDDLQYKTQALSEKIRETHELSAELERLRDENGRLKNDVTSRRLQPSNQEKLPRFSEKETSNLRDELDKSKMKILSLEKQIEYLKGGHRAREQDQAYLDQVTQVMKERKDELDQIRGQNQALEKQIKNHQDVRDNLQRRNAKLENDMDAFVRENTRLVAEVRDLRNEVRNLRDSTVEKTVQAQDRHELKERSEQLNDQHGRVKKLVDKQGGSVQNELNSQLKDYHEKKIDELSAENKALKKEKNSIMNLYENKLKEIATHNGDFAQENKELYLKIEELKAINIRLEDDLKIARSLIIKLSNDQLAIAEAIAKQHTAPERMTPKSQQSMKYTEIYKTPDRKLNTSHEKKYDYPLNRKVSPAKLQAMRSGEVRRSSPTKILRPINKNISYSLPTPREFSEFGGEKSFQNASYSLSSPVASENQRERRIATDEQRLTPNKQRVGKQSPNHSPGKKSTAHSKQPLANQLNSTQGKSANAQSNQHNGPNNYISITQVGNQNETDYDNLMGYTQSKHHLSQMKSPPQNTKGNDLEDDFKLFYSLSKILKNPKIEGSPERKADSNEYESPIRTQMVSKAISQIDNKLEVLKDSLSPRKAHRVIDEIDEQYDLITQDERGIAKSFKEQGIMGSNPEVFKPNEDIESNQNRVAQSGQLDLEKENDLPSFNHDEDMYSMLATQSNLIEQLLKTSMF